jgi:hypothetical protein
MAQLFTNNASSSLAASASNSTTTLTLATGHGAKFPAPTNGNYFLLTLVGIDGNGNENAWEIVKVTGRSNDTLTVVRGQESTTAVAWAAGSRIEKRNTAGTLGSFEVAANKGAASGYAPLDLSAKVPAINLPSYVDDVLEYANQAAFPATGETGKIYVTLDTNKTYRWSGSAYVEISASPGSTDSVVEGSTNLYFTNARARAAISVTQNLSYNSSTGAITGPDLSGYLNNTNPSYTGTLTGGTGVMDIGSGQLYKDASGNVGIGTSSPTNKLTISGTAATGATTFLSTGTTTNYNVGQFTNTGGSFYFGLDNNAGTAFTGSSAYGGIVGTGNSTSLGLVTNGSVKVTLDASGNLGLGVTPSAWSAFKAVQVYRASVASETANTYFSHNWYWSGTTDTYIASDYATRYSQQSGKHIWFTAPSGTAGNAISFTQAMTLDAGGNLGIGTSSPSASAILDAQSTTKGVRFPNMTTTQKNAISSPVAGLVIFDTTLSKLCVYTGAAWQTITSV